MKKTAMQKMIDFVEMELNLQGYEHQSIIEKALVFRDEEKSNFLNFFKWFRDNGELHIGKSMESLIDIYYSETFTTRCYKSKHIPNKEYDEIYSVENWKEIRNQMFDQGQGVWMKDGYLSNDDVEETGQEDATHVFWSAK